MGSIRWHSLGFQIVPPMPEGTTVNVKYSHIPLMLNGFNIRQTRHLQIYPNKEKVRQTVGVPIAFFSPFVRNLFSPGAGALR